MVIHESSSIISGKGGKAVGGGGMGGGVQDARKEMTKTKEQLEEEKRISLSIRIKPLDVDAMDSDQLSAKAKELWETIVKLETEKYDLEERQKRQDYDVSLSTLICLMVLNHKPFHLTAQRAQGETETTIETEGHEEGS